MTNHNQRNAESDAMFMTRLLVGAPGHLDVSNDDVVGSGFSSSAYEAQALEAALERIRAQLGVIVASCKAWKARHAGLTGEVELRYSSYEGVLCFQDLRQHWALYRHASRELRRARG